MTSDKKKEIQTAPHYRRDREFNTAKCIYCSEPESIDESLWIPHIEGLKYVYSDQMPSTKEVRVKAYKEAIGTPKTAEFEESYLSGCLGKDIDLVMLVAGLKPDGYSYLVYGYREVVA